MAFKMKGFSGFGNSPMKQVTIKPLVNKKFEKFKEDKKQTRTVKTIKRDKPKDGAKLETVKRRNETGRNVLPVVEVRGTKDKKQTKTVKPRFTTPTRGEVISAFINPFDVKNKIKTIKHYGPKIKKFLNTPVKKRK